jgi:hypothetical protein
MNPGPSASDRQAFHPFFNHYDFIPILPEQCCHEWVEPLANGTQKTKEVLGNMGITTPADCAEKLLQAKIAAGGDKVETQKSDKPGMLAGIKSLLLVADQESFIVRDVAFLAGEADKKGKPKVRCRILLILRT